MSDDPRQMTPFLPWLQQPQRPPWTWTGARTDAGASPEYPPYPPSGWRDPQEETDAGD